MIEKPKLEVSLSPALFHLFDIKDTVVVIIDIFRATSTICAALHNGAKQVIPIASEEECRSYAALHNPEYITAGERSGKIIEGLDYGNSPLEYAPEVIAGKTLVLTTTNGTKQLHLAKSAQQIIIGSFLNLDVICEYLIQSNQKVLLACSAWKDRINLEDALFAGAVVSKIQSHFQMTCDSAAMVSALYEQSQKQTSLLEFLKHSSHYKRLSNFGLYEDLAYCTTMNLNPVLPIFDGKALHI